MDWPSLSAIMKHSYPLPIILMLNSCNQRWHCMHTCSNNQQVMVQHTKRLMHTHTQRHQKRAGNTHQSNPIKVHMTNSKVPVCTWWREYSNVATKPTSWLGVHQKFTKYTQQKTLLMASGHPPKKYPSASNNCASCTSGCLTISSAEIWSIHLVNTGTNVFDVLNSLFQTFWNIRPSKQCITNHRCKPLSRKPSKHHHWRLSQSTIVHYKNIINSQLFTIKQKHLNTVDNCFKEPSKHHR